MVLGASRRSKLAGFINNLASTFAVAALLDQGTLAFSSTARILLACNSSWSSPPSAEIVRA
jgi:hypothetical protein